MNPWLLPICLSAALSSAFAAEADRGTTERFLEEVIVVAARLPRPVQDVVGTVDVVTHEELSESLAMRTADVVRYIPGVSVTQDGTRFGDSGFTIRGLSGNRVVYLIDGIPVADQFDVGDFSDATQDYLVPDAIARIEVLRGPASALFGSDALGGVVAVLTRDPEDFLDGAPLRVATSATYSGADDSGMINASLAAAAESVGGVLHVSRLDGHEIDSAAGGPEDAIDRTRDSALAKLNWTLANGDRLRVRADAYRDEVASEIETVLGFGRRYINTTSLEGDDSRRRSTAALGYDFERDATLMRAGRLDLYFANTSVEQRTDELREIAAPPLAIEREFHYDQELWGALADFEGRFEIGATRHRFGWGFSYDERRIDEYRDGLETNLLTGASTSNLLGEDMPVRDFPDSKVRELGVYVHDEMDVGRATLIPGLRFDAYEMDAEADAMYSADNPNTPVVDADQSSWSPKLGMLFRLSDGWTAFAQYAHGFRAAPFEDVNIGLDIPRFNFRAIPNPDLKPESSDGLELGLRFGSGWLGLSTSVFGAKYDDFIESRVNLGPDPATGVLIFQSQNIAEARVYGAEFKLEADLERWAKGLSVAAAANWTRGENADNDQPLNSVDPPEAVLRVAWAPRASMRFALMTTLVAAQDRVDESTADLFTPGSYVTIDTLATFEPLRNVRIDLGVFNLLDETYWQWSTVRTRPENDPMIGALSAPGRYGSASVRVAF
jgi:hemoglobin/transferrin/lactoferrin receptor protein